LPSVCCEMQRLAGIRGWSESSGVGKLARAGARVRALADLRD